MKEIGAELLPERVSNNHIACQRSRRAKAAIEDNLTITEIRQTEADSRRQSRRYSFLVVSAHVLEHT